MTNIHKPFIRSLSFFLLVIGVVASLALSILPGPAIADETLSQGLVRSVAVTPAPFSPDGDMFEDVGVISFDLDKDAQVTVRVKNYQGAVKLLWNNVVRTSGHQSVGWTGTNATGKVLPNGNYAFEIIASAESEAQTVTGTISLKNPAPIFTNVVVAPNPVSPNGDKVNDTTGFSYTLNTTANVTIDIYNWLGKIKTVTANVSRGKGPHTEGWTGTDLLGHPLSNGTYKVVLSAENKFGKTSLNKTVTVEGVVGGGPRWIYIDRSERALYLKDGNFLLKRYPIAVGMPGWETPIGTYSIVRKDINPTWYPPEWADEEAPVKYPLSPLGPRRLLLNDRSYGLHGTLSRSAIGRAVTHGCVRLYNEDIRQLYDLVPVGTLVKIVP